MEALRHEPSIYVERGADAWDLIGRIHEALVGKPRDFDQCMNKTDPSVEGVPRSVRAMWKTGKR
eukprot:8475069-Alexandrium_andersonii.AAC.1